MSARKDWQPVDCSACDAIEEGVQPTTKHTHTGTDRRGRPISLKDCQALSKIRLEVTPQDLDLILAGLEDSRRAMRKHEAERRHEDSDEDARIAEFWRESTALRARLEALQR